MGITANRIGHGQVPGILREDSITCWTNAELNHPIHFFEQAIECQHCGYERFRVTADTKCCRDGELELNRSQRLPDDLLELMTGVEQDGITTSSLAPYGISKCSRVLNNQYRFGQMVLPRIGGEIQPRISDSYQHLRITGMPYAVVPNLNASSVLRSYFDEPLERLDVEGFNPSM